MSVGILVDSVTHAFNSGGVTVTALADVNLRIAPGGRLSIVGPSGCGKTTLVALVAGLLKPTSGRVLLDSIPPTDAIGRCAVAFQSDSVYPWMTVRDNISYALRLRGPLTCADEAEVAYWLQATELQDFADFWPRQLSGGMRKRVELARALIRKPDAIGLDEPFVSLDAFTRAEMQMFLLRVLGSTGATMLFVTHDVEEAVLLGTSVAVMSKRPGTIKAIIPVALGSERSPETRLWPEFLALRAEVERALRL